MTRRFGFVAALLAATMGCSTVDSSTSDGIAEIVLRLRHTPGRTMARAHPMAQFLVEGTGLFARAADGGRHVTLDDDPGRYDDEAG